MNIEIERSLNGQYLVIDDGNIDTSDDELCMLVNNSIPGFICAELRYINDSCRIYYNISSMMSLTDVAKRQEFKYKEIGEIVNSLVTVRNSVEEYLLTGSGIIMDPQYIFYDTRERKIKYCFYPFYKKEMSASLNEIAEFILRFTDHSDKRSVKIIYDLYSSIQSGDYNFEKYLETPEPPAISSFSPEFHDNMINSIAAKTGQFLSNAPVTKQFIKGYEYIRNEYPHSDDSNLKSRSHSNSKLPAIILVLIAICLAAIIIHL